MSDMLDTSLMYTKDELPTWNEIYNDFVIHLRSQGTLDVLTQDENYVKLDSYWQIPRGILIMGLMCNQLNKLAIDRSSILRFYIGTPNDTRDIHSLQDLYKKPPIYTCENPDTGELSIFITDKEYPRIELSELYEQYGLDLHVVFTVYASTPIVYKLAQEYVDIEAISSMIEENLLSDVIEYFENGIGFKDNDGNVIPSEVGRTGCGGVGVDPAL